MVLLLCVFVFFFFFNDTATTEIYTAQYTLSLHDALPISRSSPNFSTSPIVAPKTPPFRPTSSPRTSTRASRAISSWWAWLIASMYRISAMGRLLPLVEHVPRHGIGLRQRGAVGFIGGQVDLTPDAVGHVLQRPLREQTHALQVGPKRQEGIAFPDLFQLLSRAIPLLLIIAAVRSQAWDGEFDQRGTLAALGPIVRLPGDAEALQDVASIRGHTRHAVPGGPHGHAAHRHLLAQGHRDR